MDKSFLVEAIQMLQGAQRWNFRVYAVVAPSIVGQFAPASLGQVVTGLKQLGFYDVAEVALGADLTAKAESEELLEKGKLLSSCCPAFVDYVEKNFPDLAQYISATPSPMVMIARRLKEHGLEGARYEKMMLLSLLSLEATAHKMVCTRLLDASKDPEEPKK